MELKVETSGFEELAKEFVAMKLELQEKVAFAAVGKGANVFRMKVMDNILALGLISTGDLYDNVAILRLKDQTFPEPAYEIGIRGTGRRTRGAAPFYWWFHEFGYTLRDGTHHQATPFLSPAMADSGAQNEALTQMAETLRRWIDKVNSK